MADALLSPEIGGGMYAASAALVAYSVTKFKKDDPGESRIPLMAVSGAMVFAAQMINFTIPGTGSSGHIGGGILLAALLGPFAGLLALAAVLVIQCFFFADGGLLALGCNIFNMAVIPCLFIYPLLFRRLLSPRPDARRIWIASVISVIIALQLGAFGVVVETTASGVTLLPFTAFALLMQPIHLAIGIVEGLVTAAILNFVYAARPQILTTAAFGNMNTAGTVLFMSPGGHKKNRPCCVLNRPRYIPDVATTEAKPSKSLKVVIIAIACIAVVTAVVLPLIASSNPDGLEWSIQKLTGSTELNTSYGLFTALQERLAFMPGYDFASGGGKGAPIAGIIGAALVFVVALAAGFIIHASKKRRDRQ